MGDDDKKRRNALLCTVSFHGHGVARELRNEMESTHGIAVTLDKLRADLRWLADIGGVSLSGDQVQITAEGREHAQQLRELF